MVQTPISLGDQYFQPHANCQIDMLQVVIGIGIRQCSKDPAASNWRKPVSTCNDARLSGKEIDNDKSLNK